MKKSGSSTKDTIVTTVGVVIALFVIFMILKYIGCKTETWVFSC